jgi:hypothetical protein
VSDEGLPHLRNSLRQGPALRVAPPSAPSPRLVEGPQQAYAVPPPPPRLTFWQFTLRTVPIVVALVTSAALVYFLFSERSQPFAQLQQQPEPPRQQVTQNEEPAPEAPPPARHEQQAPADQAEIQEQARAQQDVTEPVPEDLGPRLSMPNDDTILLLINSALIALNQANATGNYTVLRQIAAPGFQKANSPERLAKAFANLRGRNLDLTPVLLFQPKLYQRPVINDRGMMRITGFFPTAPERVKFDLIYQPVRGKWRLYGIAANTERVQPGQPGAKPQGAPAPAAESAQPAPMPAKKPAAKSKPAAAAVDDTPPDVRDRIDNPPPPPPAEKPKQKSGWNPFGR